jgi:hypothetical protein
MTRSQVACLPQSRERGTCRTVTATFWPWLSGKGPLNLLRCSLFARKRLGHWIPFVGAWHGSAPGAWHDGAVGGRKDSEPFGLSWRNTAGATELAWCANEEWLAGKVEAMPRPRRQYDDSGSAPGASGTGPPRGKKVPRIGIGSTVFGVRGVRAWPGSAPGVRSGEALLA